MCVVICKQKEQAKPSKDFLQKAWTHNPDGAGYMYVSENRVIIRKGFMTFEDFWDKASELPEDSAIVYHFRIATHGSKDYRGTHPFPVTNDEEMLQHPWVKTNIGIAHNGIIQLCANYSAEKNPNNLSDTQLYVRDYLARINRLNHEWYKDEFWTNIVDRTLSSKMAVLLPDHTIITFGNFSKVEGYECSNTFFMPYQTTYWDSYYSTKYTRPIVTIEKGVVAELYDYELNEWHDINEFDSVKISPRGAIFVNNEYKSEWGLFSSSDDVGGLGFTELTYDDIVLLNKKATDKKEEIKNDNTL